MKSLCIYHLIFLICLCVAFIIAMIGNFNRADAIQLDKLQACFKACEVKQNLCYKGPNKAKCRSKFQSCVESCNRFFKK